MINQRRQQEENQTQHHQIRHHTESTKQQVHSNGYGAETSSENRSTYEYGSIASSQVGLFLFLSALVFDSFISK